MDRKLRSGISVTVCSTVIALLLSRLIIYDFTSLSFFSPVEKASDYIAYDFYAQTAHTRDVKRYDDRIAVVAADGLNRAELVPLFYAIGAGSPVVTAVDIMMRENGDDTDSLLIDAVNSLGQVVYPVVAGTDDGYGQYGLSDTSIWNYAAEGTAGAVNLDAAYVRNIVRTFTPLICDSIESFVSASVRLYSPEAFVSLSKRGNKPEYIDFSSVEFDIFMADEVIDNPSIIEGRLVFVGDICNHGDMHATPVDESMAGLLIHAYAAETVLSGLYTSQVPRWLCWVIAVILCMMLIFIQTFIGDSKAGNMAMRWLQFFTLVILVISGTLLFLFSRVSFDLTLPLLMVSLGLLAQDLYMFSVWGICKLKNLWKTESGK